ncbi:MAG: hypothetical protein AB2556_23155 [Candidatus Thiodiazotropha sp.]
MYSCLPIGMAMGREGDSTHLATDEPDGLPPLPSEQRGRHQPAVLQPPSPPNAGLFCYQEMAEAEDQLEEQKAARRPLPALPLPR